jgi:hypothetical protein
MCPRVRCVIPFFLALLFIGPQISAQKAPKEVPEIARDAVKAAVLLVVSDKAGKEMRQGSGFVISNDGKFVTNYHVIEDADSALVKFSNGAFYLVEGVLGVDPAKDLAVLKAAGKDLPWLPLGNSDSVLVGEHVVAVGSPLAIEGSVSDGIISAVREINFRQGSLTTLQTTAPISPGSSGGALLNMKGEVIGVTAAQLTGGQNLNFAIPINYVVPLLSYSSPKPLAQYSTTGTDATIPASTTTKSPVPPSQNKESLAPWLVAPPPPVRWQMKVENGELYGIAERIDKACFDLVTEDLKNPSPYWNGCFMPAIIIKSHMTVPNLFFTYTLDVTIVPHYTDSERIDMTVTVEQPDHTYRTYVKKDVPIVLSGRVLKASATFMIDYDPVSVPTVDATEKGGKREATHSYR